MRDVFLAGLVLVSLGSSAADAQREAEVAARGAQVMPFDLKATRHIFTKTRGGGTQRVIARKADDTRQVKLIRDHLKAIESEFRNGDFEGPERIHGADMPGLRALQESKPGDVKIAYVEVPAGAQLTFRATKPALIAALHSWFDAQISDHGHDAMVGHQHHHQ
jgi:hypothetical protein